MKYVIKVNTSHRHDQPVAASPMGGSITTITMGNLYYGDGPTVDKLNRDVNKAIARGLVDAGWDAWVESEETVRTRL